MSTIAENGGRAQIVDDVSAIQQRREELFELEHLCPAHSDRSVYTCTRMAGSCPSSCPHIERWRRNHAAIDYCG